jgi:hypothetical protein
LHFVEQRLSGMAPPVVTLLPQKHSLPSSVPYHVRPWALQVAAHLSEVMAFSLYVKEPSTRVDESFQQAT